IRELGVQSLAPCLALSRQAFELNLDRSSPLALGSSYNRLQFRRLRVRVGDPRHQPSVAGTFARHRSQRVPTGIEPAPTEAKTLASCPVTRRVQDEPHAVA